MLALGITLGLACAVCQSLAYLGSRWYTQSRGGRGAAQLLVLSHVLQGAVALPLALILWPADLPPATRWAAPLFVGIGGYVLGQISLFWALRFTDASRVSPLLGIKLLILAAATVLLLGDPFTAGQAVAVAMSVAAAFALNYTGGAVPLRATVALLITCVGYAVSDLSIRFLVAGMEPVEKLHASVFGVAVSYALCGAGSVVLLPWLGSRRLQDWRDAAPYAFAWLAAMAALYVCFATIGVVLGNILQATRGIVSILLGALVAKLGHVHVEATVSRGVFLRRLAAGAAMVAAIVLFVVSQP